MKRKIKRKLQKYKRIEIAKKINVWAVVAIVGVLAGAVVVWRVGVFNVKQIEIQNCESTQEDKLRQDLEAKTAGELIFKINPSKLREEIIGSGEYPYVEDLTIEKYLPSKIVVKLTEKEVLICLKGKGVVDTGGGIIEGAECPELVQTFDSTSEEIDVEQINAAKELKTSLIDKQYGIKSVKLQEFGVVEMKDNHGVAGVFSTKSERSIQDQLELYDYVYSAYQSRRPSQIDVRFDKVVVKYAQ